jgi:hypothetical protein
MGFPTHNLARLLTFPCAKSVPLFASFLLNRPRFLLPKTFSYTLIPSPLPCLLCTFSLNDFAHEIPSYFCVNNIRQDVCLKNHPISVHHLCLNKGGGVGESVWAKPDTLVLMSNRTTVNLCLRTVRNHSGPTQAYTDKK